MLPIFLPGENGAAAGGRETRRFRQQGRGRWVAGRGENGAEFLAGTIESRWRGDGPAITPDFVT